MNDDRLEELLARMDPTAAMETLRRWLDSDDARTSVRSRASISSFGIAARKGDNRPTNLTVFESQAAHSAHHQEIARG